MVQNMRPSRNESNSVSRVCSKLNLSAEEQEPDYTNDVGSDYH